MAQVKIIAVGKLKEQYWAAAQAEYLKRLRPYLKLELIEVPDLPGPERMSPAEEEQLRTKEAEAIACFIDARDYLVALDVAGKQFSSPELADFFRERDLNGEAVTLVIGGSLGLAADLAHRAKLRLSFSKLTFPHQLFRVMLLEQVYRACKIGRGEPYHK
jgi:23S rRNA (pseudouridine1915-N3)-methyltransferase